VQHRSADTASLVRMFFSLWAPHFLRDLLFSPFSIDLATSSSFKLLRGVAAFIGDLLWKALHPLQHPFSRIEIGHPWKGDFWPFPRSAFSSPSFVALSPTRLRLLPERWRRVVRRFRWFSPRTFGNTRPLTGEAQCADGVNSPQLFFSHCGPQGSAFLAPVFLVHFLPITPSQALATAIPDDEC